VLGYLDPDAFLGGSMSLDADAAAHAIDEQVARPLGIGVAEAAWGIHATVNENMANAARVHAIERGVDPARLPLFVSGGNGPLHGPGVALALGAPRLLAPPAAGVLSTLGFLSAATSIDVVRSAHTTLDDIDDSGIRVLFDALEAEGSELLSDAGVRADEIRHDRSVEMRFVGQGNEVEVSTPAPGPSWKSDVLAAFGREYERKFGDVAPSGVGIELLTWRVRSSGREPEATLRFRRGGDAEESLKGHRQAYFPGAGGYVSTAVHARAALAPGTRLNGPVIIEERESTLVVPPEARCVVAEDRSIVVDLEHGSAQ